MRIGIFGGSFDPPHVEHAQLARAAIKSLRLNKLFVVPAGVPPHKIGKKLAPNEARAKACRLAFSDIPEVEICDYEMRREGASYTYLTCRYFRERFPDDELFWLVGTDMLRDFPTWKSPEEILSLVKLAVCARDEEEDWLERERAAFRARFSAEFERIEYNGRPVSSTRIRVLAGAGMRLTPFVAPSVAEYIERNGLYGVQGATRALAMEKTERAAHSLRVAYFAAEHCKAFGVSEDKAIQAALLHDCAKNLPEDAEELRGFSMPKTWGEVPPAVAHQFRGAYVAEHTLGVEDEDVLNAIRYHTSARPQMSALEKLVFLADMLEEGRTYDGVEELRKLFLIDADACTLEALAQTLRFLEGGKGEIYPLTHEAYRYYEKLQRKTED